MTLTKFKNRRFPWFSSEFSNFLGEDDFFNDRFWLRKVQNEPAMNIKETETEYQVELAAPGLSKEDFEIFIDNGYLNIYAEKKTETESQEDNYTRKEFSYNSFKRSLMLPENVKEDDIKVTYDKGVLKFNLIKVEKTMEGMPTKRIEIE
ncbi:Hsp20/alpha crystallin family protein [Flavobacteriaceae sp. LMIT009]